MGHWFAYISRGKPCLLSDILINRAEPISKQHSEHYFPRLLPHRGKNKLDDSTNKLLKIHNSLLNMDGLGITWYTKASQDYGTGVSGNWPALYESQSSPINDIIFRSLCGHTETYCLLPTSAHQVAASSPSWASDPEHADALYMTNLTKKGTKDTWENEYPLSELHHAMTRIIIQIMEPQHKHLGKKALPNCLNFCP